MEVKLNPRTGNYAVSFPEPEKKSLYDQMRDAEEERDRTQRNEEAAGIKRKPFTVEIRLGLGKWTLARRPLLPMDEIREGGVALNVPREEILISDDATFAGLGLIIMHAIDCRALSWEQFQEREAIDSVYEPRLEFTGGGLPRLYYVHLTPFFLRCRIKLRNRGAWLDETGLYLYLTPWATHEEIGRLIVDSIQEHAGYAVAADTEPWIGRKKKAIK